MLVYHDDKKSPNCFKTKILLYELDVPFEQVRHDFLKGDLKTDMFIGKFPNAKVPALEDGSIHISESGAIALYLADTYGKLIPTDPSKHAL
jgi:glutathione S-transferase